MSVTKVLREDLLQFHYDENGKIETNGNDSIRFCPRHILDNERHGNIEAREVKGC